VEWSKWWSIELFLTVLRSEDAHPIARHLREFGLRKVFEGLVPEIVQQLRSAP
jgi:hypothetical protein